jgi:hypothetical protein
VNRLDKYDKILVKNHVIKWLNSQSGYYIDHKDVDRCVESLIVKIKAFFDIEISFSELREFVSGVITEGRAHEISL